MVLRACAEIVGDRYASSLSWVFQSLFYSLVPNRRNITKVQKLALFFYTSFIRCILGKFGPYVRSFFSLSAVIEYISIIWHPIGTMVTCMERPRKCVSGNVHNITIVQKLAVLDILYLVYLAKFWLYADFFVIGRNWIYLRYLTSDWDNGNICGTASKMRFW